MPVYHFTFHAYGTWLPDKDKGYVRRKRGTLAPDRAAADLYRSRMTADAVALSQAHQQTLYKALLRGEALQRYVLLAVAVDQTHAHVVVRWDDGREAKTVRTGLKSSLSRALSARFGRRAWFVRNASQKHVADREHLDYLQAGYLPSHRGLFWRRGMEAPRGDA